MYWNTSTISTNLFLLLWSCSSRNILVSEHCMIVTYFVNLADCLRSFWFVYWAKTARTTTPFISTFPLTTYTTWYVFVSNRYTVGRGIASAGSMRLVHIMMSCIIRRRVCKPKKSISSNQLPVSCVGVGLIKKTLEWQQILPILLVKIHQNQAIFSLPYFATSFI